MTVFPILALKRGKRGKRQDKGKEQKGSILIGIMIVF
jgi:hypothetical protein